MSYVVSIRRAEDQPPFTHAELEGVAKAHDGLALDQGVLTWSNGDGSGFDLHVGPRELRADGLSVELSEQALAIFQALAHQLNARVIGEEGEDLTSGEAQMPSLASQLGSLVGGLVVVLLLPVTLLLALVRLPWVLWKLKKGLK